MPEAPDGVVPRSGRTLWTWNVWGGGADVGEDVEAEQLTVVDGALVFEAQKMDTSNRPALVLVRAFAPKTWADVKLKACRPEQ